MNTNSNNRLKEILRVLLKYGINFFTESKLKKHDIPPENIRMAFEELGPTFIKIGQMISTREDIMPKNYTQELKKLQDNTYPESFENIEKVFFEEFGVSISSQFKYFDKTPLASASISQVHRATLMDGRNVIVKVQRPHIREKMQEDVSILLKIINMSKKKFNTLIINPRDAIEEIWASTQKELDFTLEAKNIQKFKDLNKDVGFIYAPYVVNSMSSEKVLTLEHIDGIKITNKDMLIKEGYDLEDISKKLALGFLKQIFQDGFFHGDPHPGNILIKDNKICFIDFGIIGSLTTPVKEALNQALLAIVLGDVNMLVNFLISVNTKKGYINKNDLYEDVEYLFSNYIDKSFSNIRISSILNDITSLTLKHELQIPTEMTMVMKSLMLLEGVMTDLSPEIKIVDIAFTYVKNNNELIPKVSKEFLLLKAYSILNNLSKVPQKTIDVSDNIISGRTKLQLIHKNLDKPLMELNRMVNRIVFGIVVSAIIMASASLINSNIGPTINGVSFMGISGFIISGILALWLLISIIRSGMT